MPQRPPYPLVNKTIIGKHPLPWRADDGYIWDANNKIVGSMGGLDDDDFMEQGLAMFVCNLANALA